MDLMRDWLGPTIEQQLGRVLHCIEQGSAGSPSSEKVPYEDDGSNMRVRSKKVGYLQILKFQSFQDPIKAVLSDSYTSIQATFASPTVKAYVTKHRRRITKDTQGGIIGIVQYEIVATHLGPKQSSVTLLVNDLQFCGSAGSGTFGQPSPVHQRQRVGLLVQRLRELKSVEVPDVCIDSNNNELDSPSSKRPKSEAGIEGSGYDGGDRQSALATQVLFHSQMPQDEELEVAVANYVQPNKKPSDPFKETWTALNRYGLPANASRKKVNTTGDLLGLLEVRKHRTLERPATKNTRDLTKDGPMTDEPLSESSEKHGRAVEHSDTGQHSRSRRSAPQATSSKRMLVNVHGEATERLQQEASDVDGDANLRVTPKDSRVIELNTELSSQERTFRTGHGSNDTVNRRDAQKIPGRKTQAVEKHEIDNQGSKDPSIGLLRRNDTGENLTNHPWNGIERIRRRDVRIPTDQHQLLEHDDSWFPPAPGRRGPIANVPIATLQAFNAVAERCDWNTESVGALDREAVLSMPEEDQEVLDLDLTGSQQASLNTESDAEEDSDEQRLSGWFSSSTPSAPDDQLPPDSSFEVSIPPERTSRKNVPPDPTAVEEEERGISSARRRQAQVQSGCAGPGDAIQVAQLETRDVARSNNGLPSQDPAAEAQLFVGRDKVVSTPLCEAAAQPKSSLSENPARNSLDDTSELDDAMDGQTNDRDLDGNSPERYPQTIFKSESEGAVVNHPQDLKIHSPVRRNHSGDRSSEDDNLESTLPQALGDEMLSLDQEQIHGLVSPPLLPPSTASQKREPTLQVKRTPNHPREILGVLLCSNTSPVLLPTGQDGFTADSIGDRLAAEHSIVAVVPETHSLHSDTNTAIHIASQVGADGTVDNLMYDGEAVENQRINSEAATSAYKGSDKSPFEGSSFGHELPGVESKRGLDPTPHSSVVHEEKHEKRKLADMDQLPPSVTKRRKRLKLPHALNFSQENRQTQDPSLFARQHRREFLASRSPPHPATVVDDLIDAISEKTNQDAVAAEDAAQRTTSVPIESASMELDQLPPDTILHVTDFESKYLGGETALPEYTPRSGDDTPRNQSVELGDDLHFNLDKSNKASGLTAVQRSSSTIASPSSPAIPTKSSVYDTFKSTYPNYSGGLEHFSGMCQRINGLLQAERMEHRSLWDDFVIRHRTDYRDYLLNCTDRGEDPIPYESFYKHHIDEPTHHKHVLTPTTLNDAITSTERTVAAPQPERSLRSSAKVVGKGFSIAKLSRHEPCSAMESGKVIDLTLAGPAPRPTPATNHSRKLGRTSSRIEPAESEVDSPAFGNEVQTPKSALTREGSTPMQTPSRVFKKPTQTPNQQTPTQIEDTRVPVQSGGQPMPTAHNPTDDPKSPSPHETPESNRSTIVEWQGNSTSETPSPSIGESPRLEHNETEEDQWWRDRNTPFKAFTRAYAGLKSVGGAMGTVDQEGVLRPSPRQFDIFSWKL